MRISDWSSDVCSSDLSKDMALAQWATSSAWYSVQPGRSWRSVDDTTLDPIIAARRPKPFPSWSRSEDYYSEGSLVWLDADMLIRTATGGKKSLDDFARTFFGGREGDWGDRKSTRLNSSH